MFFFYIYITQIQNYLAANSCCTLKMKNCYDGANIEQRNKRKIWTLKTTFFMMTVLSAVRNHQVIVAGHLPQLAHVSSNQCQLIIMSQCQRLMGDSSLIVCLVYNESVKSKHSLSKKLSLH